eukprot:271678-Rhodomonas_salina.1
MPVPDTPSQYQIWRSEIDYCNHCPGTTCTGLPVPPSSILLHTRVPARLVAGYARSVPDIA